MPSSTSSESQHTAISSRTTDSLKRKRDKQLRQDDEPFDPPNLRFPTRKEIYEATGEYQKIGNSRVYDRKYYEKGRVYILDDPHGFNRNAGPGAAAGEAMDDFVSNSTAHTLKCDQIRRFFASKTKYFVEDVRDLQTTAGFRAFWEFEKEKWGKDELIIIYFHGRAGENGKEYQWKFAGEKMVINAYDFIKQLCTYGIDMLLILECYMPTRFKAQAALTRAARKNGTTIEVISTGQTGQGINDNDTKTNVFTQVLVNKLAGVVKDEFSLHPTVSREVFSIPELLADAAFDSNPYRLKLTKARAIKKDEVLKAPKEGDFCTYRLRIDPDYPRERSKLAFCKDTTQDTKKQREIDRYKKAAQARVAGLEAAITNDESADGGTV
ncbi:Hypothetical protein D9617_31g063490 [Elsinoe fawcettii]|nr:Hypothetical protein D9617_31g063490 [Elsinoe fawcettii]